MSTAPPRSAPTPLAGSECRPAEVPARSPHVPAPPPTTAPGTVGILRGAARRIRALFEEARRRRRRRWRLGVVVAVAVAVVAVLAVWVSSGSPRPRTATRNVGHAVASARPIVLPSEMVAWAGNPNRTVDIEVIASTTGRLIRRLAPDVGLFRGTPQATVSRSGSVFFDNSGAGTATSGPREFIEAVPLAGGAPRLVAVGHTPAVSPDGRYLAYMAFTDITNAPEGIVVENLMTGASSSWRFATNGPDLLGLWWSPNSTSLSFAADHWDAARRVWSTQVGVIDPNSPVRVLDAAPEITLPLCPPPTPWANAGATRAMLWEGYLNATEGIGQCQHAGLSSQTNYSTLLVVSLATGRVVRRLPPVHSAPEYGPLGDIAAAPSGNTISFIAPGSGAGGLYRWSIGGTPAARVPSPVLVRAGVGSATWVPVSAGGGVAAKP